MGSVEATPEAIGRLADAVVGVVELRAGDAGLLRDFYERALGFTTRADGDFVEVSDATGRALLRLDTKSAAGADPVRTPGTGLFHVAYRYPDRASLAAATERAMKARPEFQGASDHGVSEAIYLADPEGNGIELYWDRPFERWPLADDRPDPRMFTKPLDLEGLLAELPPVAGPAAADIGHIHLKSSELPATTGFYEDLAGLDLRQRFPGASFLADGLYHHHIGINEWQSQGAPALPADRPGLSSFELRLPPEHIEAAAERAEGAGVSATRDGDTVRITDPDGTVVELAPA